MPTIGDPAPLFSGQDVLTGDKFSLADHQGKAVLIAFEGLTWCGPCQFEAPILEDLWKELSSVACLPGVQFVMVSHLDEEHNPGKLPNAIQAFNISFPVLSDPAIPELYDIQGVPDVFLLDPSLKICDKKLGGVLPDTSESALKLDIQQRLHKCGDLMCFPPLKLNQWVEIVQILFGVIHDEGGVIIVGGKPIPVPPWDPLVRDVEKRNVLLGLAISELAGHLTDSKARRDLQARGLGAVETAVRKLLAKTRREPISVDRSWMTAPEAPRKDG